LFFYWLNHNYSLFFFCPITQFTRTYARRTDREERRQKLKDAEAEKNIAEEARRKAEEEEASKRESEAEEAKKNAEDEQRRKAEAEKKTLEDERTLKAAAGL
jgi:membrane protein involved in colicin uptake